MAFNFNVEKAIRKNVYAKVALMAPSGGGKTYSSLRMATGMAKALEKILGRKAKVLLGNTERGRGRYYANEFEYDIVDLESPFEPEMYIAFINYAEKAGYDILVMDSTSPEWEGEGGCLELHARAGGKYQDWAKITPRHEAFLKAIANSNIHIIATMRGKDQYEVEKEDNGRTSISKLGVGAKQRDGFEYEFTCTFNIDQKTSIATPQKDNTHLFDDRRAQRLTEEDGENIINWANSGDGFATKVTQFENGVEKDNGETVIDTERLKDIILEIDSLAKALSSSDEGNKSKVAEAIKKYHYVNGKATANYKTIKDIDIAISVLEELQQI